MEKPTIALMYDFDGTLSPDNMQEYDFMKAIKVDDKNQFWDETHNIAVEQQSSTIPLPNSTNCCLRMLRPPALALSIISFI